MKNDDKLILIGVDGVIDTNHPDNYTYKNWIIDCFRETFPERTEWMTDDYILEQSNQFGYSGELHTLVALDESYEIKLLYFISYILGTDVSGDKVEQFMSVSKQHYRDIKKYDNIVSYVESLHKACNIGLITDRCWYGCTLLSSIITMGKYSYGQFSYMTRYNKMTKEAWILAEKCCGLSRDNILVIDTNEDVLRVVQDMGFKTYLHKEGDLTALSTEVNMYLSN